MENVNINLQDNYGYTQLFKAVQNHDYNLCKNLLKEQANPNVKTIRGETCLHIAASESVGFEVADLIKNNKIKKVNERINIIHELLKYNAQPDCEDLTGFQPIHACILSSTAGSTSQLLTVLQIFIDKNIDINVQDKTDKGFAVIHFACALLHSGEYSDELDQNHVLDVVKVLYEDMNIDLLNTCKQDGMMGIHFSAQRGHIMVIEYMINKLLEQYPDKSKEYFYNLEDEKGNTILHHAALKKRDELMKWLIEQGSNPDKTNKENLTPKHLYEQKPKILYSIETKV